LALARILAFHPPFGAAWSLLYRPPFIPAAPCKSASTEGYNVAYERMAKTAQLYYASSLLALRRADEDQNNRTDNVILAA
jgi:hypothetical protein